MFKMFKQRPCLLKTILQLRLYKYRTIFHFLSAADIRSCGMFDMFWYAMVFYARMSVLYIPQQKLARIAAKPR